jgi:hypothetical protein
MSRIRWALAVIASAIVAAILLSLGWRWLHDNEESVVTAFTILLFIATAALAAVTYRLFTTTATVAGETHRLATETHSLSSQTAALARETLEASKLADQHHQESLMPLIVFEGTVRNEDQLAGQGFRAVKIHGKVKNNGLGLVTMCDVSFGDIGEVFHAGAIGPKQDALVFHELSVQFIREDSWRNGPWHLILRYQNFAGVMAQTEHFGKFNTTVFSTVFTPPKVVDRFAPATSSGQGGSK